MPHQTTRLYGVGFVTNASHVDKLCTILKPVDLFDQAMEWFATPRGIAFELDGQDIGANYRLHSFSGQLAITFLPDHDIGQAEFDKHRRQAAAISPALVCFPIRPFNTTEEYLAQLVDKFF